MKRLTGLNLFSRSVLCLSFLWSALPGLAAIAPEIVATPAAQPTDSPSFIGPPAPYVTFAITPRQAVANDPDNAPVELPDLTLDKGVGINLTLEDSVNMAIAGAASVIKAKNDADFQGSALLQSYGQFLPNLLGQANYTYNKGTVYSAAASPVLVSGSGYAAGFQVTSDLNLFNGLSDQAQLRSSSLKKDAADFTVTRVKQAISLDITQNFLQVVLDNKIVDIARKNLQESQAREDLLTEQTKVGIRNLSDLFRQQAQTSSDESFLLTSQNKTRSDQVVFLRRLRADVAKKYHFVEPKLSDGRTDPAFTNEGALMQTALKNRTDLKASDNIARADDLDVQSNFSTYLPKLDLVGGMFSGGRYLNDQTVNGADVTPAVQSNLGYQLGTQINYQIGLNLTWTLFDRFITNENVSRAKAVANDALVDAQDRRNEVEGDVRQAYGNYLTAIQQLRTSKKGLTAAEKAYEVMEGRYEVGSASFVDLVTVQAALIQAESARAQALIDFQLQTRSVQFAVGETPIQ